MFTHTRAAILVIPRVNSYLCIKPKNCPCLTLLAEAQPRHFLAEHIIFFRQPYVPTTKKKTSLEKL
jgi:hypothetical protein